MTCKRCFVRYQKKKYQQIKVTFNHLPILYDWCERVSFHVDILFEAVGIQLSLCIIILAVVTLQTFYPGKHDLLTVYLGKLDFLSVTDLVTSGKF